MRINEGGSCHFWTRVETESETFPHSSFSIARARLAFSYSIERFPRTRVRHYLSMEELMCHQIQSEIKPCNIWVQIILLMVAVELLAHDYNTF